MFAASIIIGMSVALIMMAITKMATGSIGGSMYGHAWGVFIAPVPAFFAADPAIRFVAGFL